MRLSTRAPSRRRLIRWLVVLVLACVGASRLRRENWLASGGETERAVPLPAIPQHPDRWIGTQPLSNAELRGRVWILKVWTFGCVNCVRSIPFTNALTTRFGDDVGVLGIHSPEFDWEHDRRALAAALAEHDVRFPTYVDDNLHVFYALKSDGWPLYVVVDRQTRIRGRWLGEIHAGTRRARELEALVGRLSTEGGRG
jgi:hypothetical protein